VSPSELLAVHAAQKCVDVNDLLPAVQTPTLVLLPREAVLALADTARRVATAMPNARLVPIPGKYVATDFVGSGIVTPVAEFLGLPSDATTAASALRHEALVILFADIVDSTGLTERMGDLAYRMRTADLDLRLRATIRSHDGTPLEGRLLGDGVLAVFRSGRDAIAAAAACHAAAAAIDLALHVGIHAGDVMQQDGDVHGGAVNLAARVAGIAAPGETIVTETVRGLARTSAGVAFVERGSHTLKGIDEPQRLFAVCA
jgi:class 3 adenylate cyclase